jgi:hypothetical protein
MHAYKVGSRAHFVGSPLGSKPQPAEIKACLPSENGQPGYRVQCLDDGRERHVTESELEPEHEAVG